MAWTGIATDLTLDDVIGVPRDSAPASPIASTLREGAAAAPRPARAAATPATPQAPAAQPQPYQPRTLSDSGTPARPRPHVSVTEDMLPRQSSKRVYWLLGAMALTIAVLVVGPLLMRNTPPEAAPEPAVAAVEAEAPGPVPTADDTPDAPGEWTGAPPKKALLTPAVKKAKPVSHDVDHVEPRQDTDGAEPNGAGDISLDKFRQLSGKI